MIEYLYRMLTDKKVHCQRCRELVGYMTRKGHADWLCAECGGGQPQALNWEG